MKIAKHKFGILAFLITFILTFEIYAGPNDQGSPSERDRRDRGDSTARGDRQNPDPQQPSEQGRDWRSGPGRDHEQGQWRDGDRGRGRWHGGRRDRHQGWRIEDKWRDREDQKRVTLLGFMTLDEQWDRGDWRTDFQTDDRRFIDIPDVKEIAAIRLKTAADVLIRFVAWQYCNGQVEVKDFGDDDSDNGRRSQDDGLILKPEDDMPWIDISGGRRCVSKFYIAGKSSPFDKEDSRVALVGRQADRTRWDFKERWSDDEEDDTRNAGFLRLSDSTVQQSIKPKGAWLFKFKIKSGRDTVSISKVRVTYCGGAAQVQDFPLRAALKRGESTSWIEMPVDDPLKCIVNMQVYGTSKDPNREEEVAILVKRATVSVVGNYDVTPTGGIGPGVQTFKLRPPANRVYKLQIMMTSGQLSWSSVSAKLCKAGAVDLKRSDKWLVMRVLPIAGQKQYPYSTGWLDIPGTSRCIEELYMNAIVMPASAPQIAVRVLQKL